MQVGQSDRQPAPTDPISISIAQGQENKAPSLTGSSGQLIAPQFKPARGLFVFILMTVALCTIPSISMNEKVLLFLRLPSCVASFLDIQFAT